MLQSKILITGGAGFLGRAIMKVAHDDGWDAQFTVLSRDEMKQAACKRKFPGARYVLGDVLDTPQLATLMVGHDVVIHAAAMKYIPEGEFNPYECIRVNIDGAQSVIQAARAARVSRVVGVSTDKAAQPINTYGMTKALMERLFWGASTDETIFTTCRYGNVVGSTGSVVPAMLDQWRTKGRVQITHEYMTRFWMPYKDAVATIVRASSASPGITIIPRPRAASMYAMAYAVLVACGESSYPPEGDIRVDPRIEIIGARPGEKQHEDLISQYELPRITPDGDYMLLMPPQMKAEGITESGIVSNHAPMLDIYKLADMIRESLAV